MPSAEVEVHELSPRGTLLADVAIGLGARLALVLALPRGFGEDLDIFRSWARSLSDSPLSQFYAGDAPYPRDHLPGDLWILAALSRLHEALGVGDLGFDVMVRLVAIAADLVVALLLRRIVRERAGEQAAARTLRWYLLCPAPLLVSAAWGQWDGVSIAITLVAVHLVLRGGSSQVIAAPVLTWAVLVKPQLALVAVLLVGLVVVRQRQALRDAAATRRVVAIGWLTAVASSVTLAIALTLPFGIGLWWTPVGGRSLASVVQEGLDLYPFTTAGAANLWQLPDGAFGSVRDDVPLVGPVTASSIGTGLLVAFLALALYGAWTLANRDDDTLVAWGWATALTTVAAFVLLTRVHERYLLPGLVLMLLVSGLRPEARWPATCFWVAGVALAGNIVLVLVGSTVGADRDVLAAPLAAVALTQVAVLATWAMWPWVRRPRTIHRDSHPNPTT